MTARRNGGKLTLISEEASEWFVRLKDRDLTAAERREHLRWLKASPLHIAEMLRVYHVHALVRSAKPEKPAANQAATSNVIELSSRDGAAGSAPRPPTAWRQWKIAAACAAITLAGLLALLTKLVWLDGTIHTQASEWRSVTLTDGSFVRIGPHTRLRVDLSDSQRLIELSRGEAVFQVAKDPARPFLVSTELAVVRAVGTEFGVSRVDDRVVVTVVEGEVSVSQHKRFAVRRGQNDSQGGSRGGPQDVSRNVSEDGPGSGPRSNSASERSIAVSAGHQIAVSQIWPVAAQEVNTARELAWATGRLIFDDVTVADAVAQFNRLNRVQIVVGDPQIAQRSVHGVFDAADPHSFVQAVAVITAAKVVRNEPDVLQLEASSLRNDHGQDDRAITPPAADTI